MHPKYAIKWGVVWRKIPWNRRTFTEHMVASQAAWKKNGKRAETRKWEKISRKKGKWPTARNGEKMAQQWWKNGFWGHFSIFSPFLGHFFSISGRGPFSIFRLILSHFGFEAFRPVFHSMPGGLTRKHMAYKLRLLWHTNSDFYGIQTPAFVPYEPFLLGVCVVSIRAWLPLNETPGTSPGDLTWNTHSFATTTTLGENYPLVSAWLLSAPIWLQFKFPTD